MFLARCRNSTVGHPSEDGSQLLLEPTIALGLFLRLSAAAYSYMPVPILVLQCSDSFHCGLFLWDFPML
jgi:hypothetical protein